MIDQEKQSTYSGQLSHYSVTLVMSENLEIKVWDNEVLQKFHATISREFINKQDMLFTSLFKTPRDVFIYLTENFSQVVVDKEVLRFSYISEKKEQVKQLELVREELEENALVHLKMAKIEEHFTAQLRHKEDRIATLQQELRQHANQFREYKKESKQKIERSEDSLKKEQIYSKGLEGKIQIQENTIKILEERLQREEKITRELGERMQMLEKSSKSIQERLEIEAKSSKEIEEKISITNCQIVPISHHPNNPHQQYFTLTNSTANSAKLVKVGKGGGWYNFVNKTEVLPNQRSKYTVSITKVKYSQLIIGLCTDNGFGHTKAYKIDESVYYICCGEGQLWKGGYGRYLSGCGSVDGDLVECVVDWPNQVTWSKSGKVLAECPVPAEMKDRLTYFSIILQYEGDTVEASSVE